MMVFWWVRLGFSPKKPTFFFWYACITALTLPVTLPPIRKIRQEELEQAETKEAELFAFVPVTR